MKIKVPIRLATIVAVLLVVLLCSASAQQAKFRLPFVVTDSVTGKKATIYYGVHPSGTNCVSGSWPTMNGFTDHWDLTTFYPADAATLEEGPPPPPDAIFFAGFLQPCSGLNDLAVSVKAFTSTSEVDSFQVDVINDAANPTSTKFYSWPDPTVLAQYADSIVMKGTVTIRDTVDGDGNPTPISQRISVHLEQVPSYTARNFGTTTGIQPQLKRFKVYIYHPKVPSPLPLATVNLTYPPRGATDTSGTFAPKVAWDAVPGAWRYQLIVSTDTIDTNVTAFVFNDSIPAGTTVKQLPALKADTKYFWKVFAYNNYGYSYVQNPQFWFRTQSALKAPNLLGPPDNAPSLALPVTFQWNASASQTPVTYRLQISTDAGFNTLILDSAGITDTNATTLRLQSCYRYYWRVKAVNSITQSPYGASRTFRVALATPAMPNLLTPANGAAAVSSSPTLTWSGDACTDSYRLQVAKDTGFTNLIVNLPLTAASKAIGPLDEDSVYYWRVMSINAIPDSSGFTTAFSFRTKLNPPAVPSLVTPPAADTNQTTAPSFIWSRAKTAKFYHFQLSRDSTFRTFVPDGVNDSTLTDTTLNAGPLSNCIAYFWRVRSKNDSGSLGFTTTRKFRVRTAIPDSVTLLYPPDNQDNVVDRDTLRWQGDACSVLYTWHVSTSPSFADTAFMGTTTGSSVIISGLKGNFYYYWRVKAANYLGEGLFTSGRRLHTTLSFPAAPVQVYPPDNTAGLPMTVTFIWDSAVFAQTYHLQVTLDSSFAALSFEDTAIVRVSGVEPSRTFGGLLNSHLYFWRVRARNSLGNGPWSNVRRFSTLYPPSVPHQDSPLNNEKFVVVSPTFVWSLAQRADQYQLQVARDNRFTSIISTDTTTLTSYTVYGLSGHTVYFWRIRGGNLAGWGPWSDTLTFTTTWIGSSRWVVPLLIAESGPERDFIYFGVNHDATMGIDTALDEFPLPPVQPGMFDIRFISPYIGEGLAIDIHPFSTYTQSDTFQFEFQPGYGEYPMMVSWPASFVRQICDSARIVDKLVSPTISVRMDIDSSLQVSKSTITNLTILMYGAFPVLGVKPLPVPIPGGYALSQNYPNPFNPTTHVRFSLEHASRVRVDIYDMLGRQVATLAQGLYTSGEYTLDWNGMTNSGSQAPSGVYYLRMIASGFGASDASPVVLTRKMMLLK